MNHTPTSILMEALRNQNGKIPRLIAETGIDVTNLLLSKSHDYGHTFKDKPFFAPDLDPKDAILVRMSDKAARIGTLRTKQSRIADESIRDTIRDIAGYAILWLVADHLGEPDPPQEPGEGPVEPSQRESGIRVPPSPPSPQNRS